MPGRLALLALCWPCLVMGIAPNFPVADVETHSVVLKNAKMSLQKGRVRDAVAWGSFTDVIDKTGWAVLDIHTAPSANGDTQSYAAGFLEGALTHKRITQHLQNMWGVDFKGYAAGTVPEKIRDFVSANMDWMVSKVKENPSDSYWQTIGYLLAQLHGLADGYEAARDADGYNGLPLTVEDMLMLVMVDTDMDDVVTAVVAEGHLINQHFLHRRHQRRHRMFDPFPEYFDVSGAQRRHHGHCSALVQVAPDLTDLWVAHATWDEYRGMLRIIKYFDMPLPGVKVQRLAFTADPGGLYSADDFYVLDSKLVVMETTIDNYNRSLWSQIKPESVMTWARAMVANRQATSGDEWTEHQVRHSSGTCNNQWMVVDYKRFEPGKPLKDGVLWISETMPGHSQRGDVTHVLQKRMSWPSYNIPYFEDIWKVGGYEAMQKKTHHPDDFSFDKCPRALMFERARQEGAGSSLSSLMALIRYNRIDDPLARGDACNGISARCDLNPHKHVSYDCFGAIDAKIARWRNFSEDLSFLAVSSPTWGGNERPFSWSEVNPEVDGCQASDHRGHPNTFDFSWYQLPAEWPQRTELQGGRRNSRKEDAKEARATSGPAVDNLVLPARRVDLQAEWWLRSGPTATDDRQNCPRFDRAKLWAKAAKFGRVDFQRERLAPRGAEPAGPRFERQHGGNTDGCL